ncbi:hypothetical protein QL285_018892 [Trifolium repens]|nr:hypothetical protein QL285_018892 [Trifolium repens]
MSTFFHSECDDQAFLVCLYLYPIQRQHLCESFQEVHCFFLHQKSMHSEETLNYCLLYLNFSNCLDYATCVFKLVSHRLYNSAFGFIMQPTADS